MDPEQIGYNLGKSVTPFIFIILGLIIWKIISINNKRKKDIKDLESFKG